MFLLIPAAFLISSGSFSQSGQKLTKTKQQLEEEIRYTNSLLDQTKKSKEVSLNRLRLLNRQIQKREALIGTISKEIEGVETQIDEGSRQIDRLSGDLKVMKADYSRMIYLAYKTMNANSRLVFLFSAKDFNQAFQRFRYYQQVAQYRRRQAEKIRVTQIEINQKRNELVSVRDQKMTLIQSEEQEREKLRREQQEKDRSVKQLTKKEKELLSTLKTKEASLKKLKEEIEKVIAAERSGTTGAGKSATAAPMTPAEKKLSGNFAANKGGLPWPSEKGVVVSTFGEHPHPVLQHVKVRNNGIDIAVEKGTPVRSVFNGKVSRVLSLPNLHKVVIIRHGEYLTVYSNLETVTVTDGQEITTKQTIGRVYSDPEDGKTELHFELWLGKSIQNPQEWLSN